MLQSSKYIGQGFVIDYLIKNHLSNKFNLPKMDEIDNHSKLNFIVTPKDSDKKIGVYVTITSDDIKLASFVKRKNDMIAVANKALYLFVNLSLYENEQQNEDKLIGNILNNIEAVINLSLNDNDDLIAYQVSSYGMEKQDLARIISYIKEYKIQIADKARIEDELNNPLEASLVRIKGKLLIIKLEEGTTHIGVVDYDATNKENILEEMKNSEVDVYGKLVNPIKVLVKMEPNKEPGRPDMARIISLR